jgi:hypothetical protein
LNCVTNSLNAATLERIVAAVPGATADDLLVLTSERTEGRSEPRLRGPQVSCPPPATFHGQSATCRSDEQIGQKARQSATSSTDSGRVAYPPRHLTIAEAKTCAWGDIWRASIDGRNHSPRVIHCLLAVFI